MLEVKNLSKRFGSVLALDKISLRFRKGEIHGLIGANGSGKSTLMNILNGEANINKTGGYTGEVYIDGKKAILSSRLDAIGYGIEMVHQELSLLDKLSVVENIKLNNENTLSQTDFLREFSLLDGKKNREDAAKSLEALGVSLNLDEEVENFNGSEKQFIEIARGIDKKGLKVLMLDEPTSSLNREETRELLSHVKKLSGLGITIVFVSHRLEEVLEICDRVSVLRDGKLVSEYERDRFDIDRIGLDMVGRSVVKTINDFETQVGEELISFNSIDIRVGSKVYKDLSLRVNKGEVLGLTGLAGHGYELFPYSLMGLYAREGSIKYRGREVSHFSNKELVDLGIYLIPDDRKRMSLLLNKPIWENMVFESYDVNKKFLRYPSLARLSLINKKEIFRHCEGLVEDLNIKIDGLDQAVHELSGGNQQKVCVARAITMNPELLFIGEPTRGIDIYSKEVLLDILLDLNKKNSTTLVIYSGEIEELMRVCSRIVVMNENRVLGSYGKDDFNKEEFRLAISGRRGGVSEKG